MEAVVIKPRTKSDMRFLLDFAKRSGFNAKTINTLEDFEDECLIALIEEGLKTPKVSMEAVMNALTQ